MTAARLHHVVRVFPGSMNNLIALTHLCSVGAPGLTMAEAQQAIGCDGNRWSEFALGWHACGWATRILEVKAGAGRRRHRYFPTPKAFEVLGLKGPTPQ
jgi:hypothetical protein